MRLNARVSSERQARTVSKSGNEFVNVDLYVGNKMVGTVELVIYDDIENGYYEDEWLLKYRKDHDSEWDIIRKGHIK